MGWGWTLTLTGASGDGGRDRSGSWQILPRLGFGSPAEKGDPGECCPQGSPALGDGDALLPVEPGPGSGLAEQWVSTYCSRMYEDWKMRCHMAVSEEGLGLVGP